MPKEITYSDEVPWFEGPDGGEIGVDRADSADKTGLVFQRGVHVGWTRDGYVEMGVAQYVTETAECRVGQFTTLDRAGVNRVIRSLRKARDAAFGRDE